MHGDSISPEAYSFYHKHQLFLDEKSEIKAVILLDAVKILTTYLSPSFVNIYSHLSISSFLLSWPSKIGLRQLSFMEICSQNQVNSFGIYGG
jgi:hypothetical protein